MLTYDNVGFEESLSYRDQQNSIAEALKREYPKKWVWVRDLWDDHAIYSVDTNTDEAGPSRTCLFSRTYDLNEKGKVTLGDPLEVKAVTQYVAIKDGTVIERALEERDIPQSERDKMDAADFAGPDQSFPIATAADVKAAAHLIGKAKDPAAVKAKIISIAKRKGFSSSLPDDWVTGDDSQTAVGEEAYVPCLTSNLIPLIEKAVKSDNTIRLKIIQPGWGSSGYYSADLLKRDGPKAFPRGTQMYMDHPTESESRERPERSVRDLAGVIDSTPVYEEKGPAGPGLYADAKVLPDYAPAIEQLSEHIGVSIRGHGSFEPGSAEGRKGPIIKKLTSSESVDFVTKAGAGGKVLPLLESIRTRMAGHDTIQPANDAATEAAPTGTSLEDSMELKEAEGQIAELNVKLTEAAAENKALLERAEKAEVALALAEAKGIAVDELAKAALPQASKVRLAGALVDKAVVKEGKLDTDAFKAVVTEAIAAEVAYVAEVTGSGVVKGQGAVAEGQGGIDPAKLAEKASHVFPGMTAEMQKTFAEGRR